MFVVVSVAIMKTSAFVGASVDGFIARRDDGLDWLDAAGNDPHGYEEFIATVDVIVIGRRTYDVVLAFPQWPYGAKTIVVLSSRPIAPPPQGAIVEQMSGGPAEIVERLSSRGFQHAYVDGGVTIQRFLRAGALQRLVVSRVPVLIGTGIPLFAETGGDVALKHIGTRAFPSGLVQSEYEVVR